MIVLTYVHQVLHLALDPQRLEQVILLLHRCHRAASLQEPLHCSCRPATHCRRCMESCLPTLQCTEYRGLALHDLAWRPRARLPSRLVNNSFSVH